MSDTPNNVIELPRAKKSIDPKRVIAATEKITRKGAGLTALIADGVTLEEISLVLAAARTLADFILSLKEPTP